MNLNELTETLLSLKEQRAALSAKDRELAQQETSLKSELTDVMSQLGTSQVPMHGKAFRLKTKAMPSVNDCDAFYQYVESTHSFHLLHRRLATTALNDLRENDMSPPGVEWVEEHTVAY